MIQWVTFIISLHNTDVYNHKMTIPIKDGIEFSIKNMCVYYKNLYMSIYLKDLQQNTV